jgi:hypothetical protein
LTPNRSLKDERPIDHLQTEVGRNAVGRALLETSGAAIPGIFLSHNWNDKPFVRKLALDLTNLGAKVWLDEVEMNVGDSLIEAIRTAIDDMDFLAVVLSPNSVGSEWVKREVDIAMNQEIEGRRIKVLPLMYQPCELPGFLKGKLYADFRTEDRYAKGLQTIAKRLGLQSELKSVASSPRSRPPSASTRIRRKRAG